MSDLERPDWARDEPPSKPTKLERPDWAKEPTAKPKAAPTPDQYAVPGGYNVARNVVGAVAEPLFSMGTGLVAKPISDIAGLGTIPAHKLGLTQQGPQDVQSAVQSALTYQPRTTAGKGVTEYNPLALIGKGIGWGAGKIGGGIESGAEALGTRFHSQWPQIIGSPIASGIRETFEQAPAFAARPMSTRVAKPPKVPLTQAEKAAGEVRGQGWILPPTQVNPSMLNRIVEGWAGKWSTQQEASIKNQPKVNSLARRAIGLRDDAPLTSESLDAVRDNASQAYTALKAYDKPIKFDDAYKAKIEDLTGEYSEAAKRFPDIFKGDKVADLQKALLSDPRQAASIGVVETLNKALGEQPGVRILPGLEARELMPTGVEAPKGPPRGPPTMTATEAIETVKTLRKKASDNLGAKFADPEARSIGFAQKRAADAIEELVERQLEQTGQKQLVADYRAARTRIAQTYDVESALNQVTGNVDARHLGRLLDKRPLSAQLEDIARFASVGPKVARPPETFGGHPGINPWDLAFASIHGITGNPSAAARGLGLALGRPVAAKMGTSDWYQNRFVQPRGTVPPTNIPPWIMALIQQQSAGRQ